MAFADNLKQLPPVAHLSALELFDTQGALAGRIENKPGQAGSLAVYAALAVKYGRLNTAAAEEALVIYAEHTDDARQNPGKHPNIDRLLAVVSSGQGFEVRMVPQGL